jgi:mannose-1-phosphate guanylyltransferase
MIDLSKWPALVLAAGFGTRLRPLSTVRAKAALPVAGRPLVARILEQLHAAGVRRVVVNLHHRPESITRIVGDGSAFGLEVRYSWETDVLGSAGGPARALPLLAADRFFVVNGDTLSSPAYDTLASAHVNSGARVTMMVAPADLAKYNAVLADGAGVVTGFAKRGTALAHGDGVPAPYHFIGVQAMNASALSGVSRDATSESVRDLYPRLIASDPGSVRVHPVDGEFFDIGTPADYLETVRRLATSGPGLLDCGAGTEVAPSARVEGSVLWDRVRIGENAEVVECVVADDVTIEAGARYHRQAITRDQVAPL